MVSAIKKYHMNILEFLMALLIMLNANTVFSKSNDFNYRLEYIGAIISVVLCSVVLIREKNKEIRTKWMAFAICYMAVMLFYIRFHSVMTNKTALGVMLFFLPAITLYLIYAKQSGRYLNILKYYSDICMILAVVSLIYWIIGPLTRWIYPYVQYGAYWGVDRKYNTYSMLYYTQSWQSVTILGYEFRRNVGIFCEGPMFSLALTISFAYDFYIREAKRIEYLEGTKLEWINKVLTNKYIHPRAAFLLLVNLTTVSVTGIMISVLLLFIKFYQKMGERENTRKIRNIILGVSFVITVGALVAIFLLKSSSKSWQTRVDDYLAGLKTWMQHKLLGAKLGNMTAIQENMSDFRKNNLGTSNSITTILGQGGIVLGLIYMIPLAVIFIKGFKEKRPEFPIFAVFVIEFVVTYFPYTFLLLLAVGYGCAEIISMKWKIKAKEKNEQ